MSKRKGKGGKGKKGCIEVRVGKEGTLASMTPADLLRLRRRTAQVRADMEWYALNVMGRGC